MNARCYHCDTEDAAYPFNPPSCGQTMMAPFICYGCAVERAELVQGEIDRQRAMVTVTPVLFADTGELRMPTQEDCVIALADIDEQVKAWPRHWARLRGVILPNPFK